MKFPNIAGYDIKPCRHVSVRGNRGPSDPHQGEAGLRDVFGKVGVFKDGVGEIEDHSRILVIQRRKRLNRRGIQLLYEYLIFFHDVAGILCYGHKVRK